MKTWVIETMGYKTQIENHGFQRQWLSIDDLLEHILKEVGYCGEGT